jgi:hypothetical protein
LLNRGDEAVTMQISFGYLAAADIHDFPIDAVDPYQTKLWRAALEM